MVPFNVWGLTVSNCNWFKAAEPLGGDSLLLITNKYQLLIQPFTIVNN